MSISFPTRDKTSAGFKLTAIVALGAFLASSAAMAQGPAQPVCRGGALTDAASGAPLLDPNRNTIPCTLREGADGSMGGYVIGGLVLASLAGVGICAGVGCFNQSYPNWFYIPTGGNNNFRPATSW